MVTRISTARQTTRMVSFLLLSAALSGCVTVNSDHLRNSAHRIVADPTDSALPASYDAAMAKLLAARTTMLAKAKHRETFDTVTKTGTAIGLTGAATSSLSEKAADPIAGYLIFGGLNYAANKNINPMPLATIYRTGAKNLECIRTASIQAHNRVGKFRAELILREVAEYDARNTPTEPQVGASAEAMAKYTVDRQRFDNDRQKFYQDLVQTPDADLFVRSRTKANVDNALYRLSTAVAKADNLSAADRGSISATLKEANALIKDAGEIEYNTYATTSDIVLGERILNGVDDTIYAVDTEAIATTPDIEAIKNSGASLVDFVKTGQKTDSDLRTLLDKLGKVNVSSSDPGDAGVIKKEINAATLELRDALSRLPRISADAELQAITECRYPQKGRTEVTIPTNPVALKIGQTATVKPAGSAPFMVTWDGPHADIKSDIGLSDVTLSAADKAKAGTYHFHIRDSKGVDSAMLTLDVAAAEAAAAATDSESNGTTGNTANNQNPENNTSTEAASNTDTLPAETNGSDNCPTAAAVAGTVPGTPAPCKPKQEKK